MKTAHYTKLLFFFPYKYLQKSDKTAKRSEIITHWEKKNNSNNNYILLRR